MPAGYHDPEPRERLSARDRVAATRALRETARSTPSKAHLEEAIAGSGSVTTSSPGTAQDDAVSHPAQPEPQADAPQGASRRGTSRPAVRRNRRRVRPTSHKGASPRCRHKRPQAPRRRIRRSSLGSRRRQGSRSRYRNDGHEACEAAEGSAAAEAGAGAEAEPTTWTVEAGDLTFRELGREFQAGERERRRAEALARRMVAGRLPSQRGHWSEQARQPRY